MKIEIWDNRQVRAHLDEKNYPVKKLSGMSEVFKGFSYFSPEFIEMRLKTDESIVNSEKDKSIVALENTDLVGVFSFLWMKGYDSFYHYFPRFIDVRSDLRNKGIGTALVKRLNEPCFLWGETLKISALDYSSDGDKYIRKVIERELTGEHFKIFDVAKVGVEPYR